MTFHLAGQNDYLEIPHENTLAIPNQISEEMKNTSKKKRYTKKYRVGASTEWIRNYTGKNIVRAYSKWFGVDLICSIKELRKKGIEIDEDYEHKIRQKEEAKKIARQKNKENRARNRYKQADEFSDARFAYIVGYTAGGAAYGITHEEMQDPPIEASGDIF